MLHNRQIGPYRIKRMLGTGGFGEVYLVTKDGKEYALKRLVQVAHYIKDRFFKEATRVNKLREEHGLEYIISIHEVLADENAYSMEYLPEGCREYWSRSREEGFIPRLAQAVQQLHRVNVIHRDIKPENIRTRGTTPVLIDFGITSWQDSTTGIDMGIGTPIYSPPESILHAAHGLAAAQRAAAQVLSIKGVDMNEQIRNAKKLHDVYSLGLSIGYLCTGGLPFSESDFLDYLRTGKAVRHTTWIGAIPEHYRAFVREATSFYPLDRPYMDYLVATYFKQRPVAVTIIPEPKEIPRECDFAYCFLCGKAVETATGKCASCGAPRSYLALQVLPASQPVRVTSSGGPKIALRETGVDGRRETLLLLPFLEPEFELTIGKEGTMDIVLDDDQWMSRRHGRFIKKGSDISFFDGVNETMPKNPSRYDGYMIGAGGIVLQAGGHLVIGSTLCLVQYCCGEPGGAPGTERRS